MENRLMRTIRGLVVEDELGNAELITQTLALDFRNLYSWKVDWTVCNNALAAREMVNASEPFQFAIVDYELGNDRQNGLTVVEELRRGEKNQHAFVLVITNKGNVFPSFADDARKAGATGAILRARLIVNSNESWSFPDLTRRIRNHVIATDPQPDSQLVFDDDDAGVLAILQTIGGDPNAGSEERGRAILRALAIRCIEPHFPEMAKCRVSRLAEGRSGAHVCRLDVTASSRPSQSFVLKLGLDRRVLDHERRANGEARAVLGDTSVVAIEGDVHSDGSGYHAVVAKIAEGAQTLSVWLADDETRAEQTEQVAKVLFGEILAPLFQEGLQDSVPVEQWLSSPPLLRLRVNQSLGSLRDAATHPDGGGCRGASRLWELLDQFVNQASLPVRQADRVRGNVMYVGTFGDLHSGNVLVRRGVFTMPILIDASGYGRQHWGRDGSRLLVDLFLRARAAGVQSMMWSDFADSARAAARLCPLAARDPVRPSDPVSAFIDAVVRDLRSHLRFSDLGIPQSDWHWQWHVALAKEFLRQACHVDLTPPRSTLALMSSARHLRFAVRLLDAIRY
jgi:CheY-like chemotaxis protein